MPAGTHTGTLSTLRIASPHAIAHRRNANVLWLHFDDLQEDLEGCVREIAAFMPCIDEHDEELIAISVKQASLEFMKQVGTQNTSSSSSSSRVRASPTTQHPTKYDEHHLKLARNQVCGRPRLAGIGTTSTKVRGLPKQELPAHTLQAMLDRYARRLVHAYPVDRRRRACTLAHTRLLVGTWIHIATTTRVPPVFVLSPRWKEVVLPVTGYATYEAMRQGINRELGRARTPSSL